jgi:MarR family transcriptional regulator, organic hydroperoxide resistance regulator
MDRSPNIPQPDQMLCFSVYAAGLAFNRLYRDLLKHFDLTYPQFLVLLALRQKNDRKVNDLGDALFLESNTLTPLLKRMEQSGLLARRRSLSDERSVLISLTEKGARLTEELDCVPPQVLGATHYSIDEFTALTTRLNTLADTLRAHVRA